MRTDEPLHHAGMPGRIGLVGAECSGKSTLAAALADALPGCVVHEVLRERTATLGRPPLRDEQEAILRKQAAREDEAARTCARPWLVADPAPLMTAVYSWAYFDDDRLVAAGLAHAQAYELMVWCAPDIAWVPDPGQRDGIAHRTVVDELLGTVLSEHLESERVVHVFGTVEDRVAAVRDRLAWQPGALMRPT